jgi:hypothetical protein
MFNPHPIRSLDTGVVLEKNFYGGGVTIFAGKHECCFATLQQKPIYSVLTMRAPITLNLDQFKQQ